MIPMTPSSPACYEGAAGGSGRAEEGGSGYWPAASVSPGVPLSTSGDEGAGGTKVRKPYTITKQRERWTDEEHQKFLEALKLYGRAWRRIEEHIGTKTAVQIRSHAQKFFSKIERDVTAGQQQGAETGVAQVIDIPPPRPKRKPTHPYPRKAGRRTSEDECLLATAGGSVPAAGGSISSSSGISTAAVVEGCSKSSSAWEQDGEDHDAAKDGDAAPRAWGIRRPVATAGSSPAVAPNVAPAVMSPISAFPAPMPWGRMFGGGINPAAMVSPTMMMPWGSPSNPMENGGAVSAMAATMAAASAWWAMQGGLPPGLMHPAMGAMFMAGGTPPLAIPAPFLFPQCTPQEVTVAAVPIAEAKEVPMPQDDAQEPPSSSRSSAMRRAERAQRVKELKARRMGSGNHLLSVSSDICASTSGTNLTAGQVTNGSESAVNYLSTGVPLKHGLVRKEPADAALLDDENRKRVRSDSSQVVNAHLEKLRSVSGSNKFSTKFSNIEATYDEASPNDNGSCGSDNSAGAGQLNGNGSRCGPSSNSSVCGNVAEGNDRSGCSDGSSEGEATCKVQTEKNDRSSEEKVADASKPKTSKQITFNEFLPVRKDEKPEGSSRLPRTASIDGDRKEVTERGQIAFQALFERDTLPRTFSPPPGLALSLPSKPALNRCLSANALELRTSPLRTRKDHDSAFNTWENLRGTCSASKVDRCESGVSIPSLRPTTSLEDLQSSKRRRISRKGRSNSIKANTWLQLAPTSSLDDAEEEGEEDESADSGADEKQQQQQAQESFVCKLDLLHQENEDDDGPGTVDVGSQSPASLSLTVGTAGVKNVTHNCSSSVSTTRTVKYSGVGFVPYQRASTQAPLVEKL